MKNYWTIFTNGLVKENPLLVLMIGLCSSLAVTTSFSNGLGMGTIHRKCHRFLPCRRSYW